MCDCNCIDTTINCECPPSNPLEGSELDSVLSTTFDGAPLNIYNSGSGASTLLYTNTSSANENIIINKIKKTEADYQLYIQKSVLGVVIVG